MMRQASVAAKPPIVLLAPSLWRRMMCWLYEGILLFGVVFISSYLFSSLSQTRHALSHRTGQQAFIFLILGIYFTWFWHKGHTLAMKTWHIRIVDAHGALISQTRAFCRYILSWLWFGPALALLWALQWPLGPGIFGMLAWVLLYALMSRLHPMRQFWHDALAGTRLIDVRNSIR